jgi:hypothetical protein
MRRILPSGVLVCDGATKGAVATIGRRLTSEHDTARLLEGYIPKAGLEKNLAPYNVGLYGDGSKPGPIFPVNRWRESQTELDPEKSLVVVWYESRQGILWPYQPEYFNRFEWPTESRIVIASRLGSEGVDANGKPQVSFDGSRFEQVSVYNQPDPKKPGYNPNEEHAFVAPSFAFGDSPRPPPTVFALRNDLNIHETLIAGKNALKTEYTSEPYVLAQYRETPTGEWGMKAYRVEMEDPTVSGELGGNSIGGTLRIPVVVSGLVGTIQDISIELDLDNHRQVGDRAANTSGSPAGGCCYPGLRDTRGRDFKSGEVPGNDFHRQSLPYSQGDGVSFQRYGEANTLDS